MISLYQLKSDRKAVLLDVHRLSCRTANPAINLGNKVYLADVAHAVHMERGAWDIHTSRLVLPRKEVIQPQLPLRLPCYDFVPVASPTFDSCLLAVSPPTSGVTDSHDVTGGVYKARERIHRTIADARLLATPTSCRRVAAYNPN
jgi:hypothetical protein